MWLLSLKIALRPNKRFILAIIGVAICVMYISGTAALVGGLKESRDRLLAQDDAQFYLCSKENVISDSVFTAEEVAYIGSNDIFWGVLTPVSFSNVSTYLLGYSDPLNLIAGDPVIENYSGILVGPSLVDDIVNESLVLNTGYGVENALVEGFFESSLFPADWILANRSFAREVSGLSSGQWSFFITDNLTGLNTEGLVIQTMGSKQGFFVAGVSQVESDLWLLSTVAGMIAIIVVYNLMYVEILARRNDIQVLQGVGGGRRWIIGVFTLESAVASLIGGVLGIIFGIVGSNLILSGFAVFGYTYFLSSHVSLVSTLLPMSVALISGVLGGGLASISCVKKVAEGVRT